MISHLRAASTDGIAVITVHATTIAAAILNIGSPPVAVNPGGGGHLVTTILEAILPASPCPMAKIRVKSASREVKFCKTVVGRRSLVYCHNASKPSLLKDPKLMRVVQNRREAKAPAQDIAEK